MCSPGERRGLEVDEGAAGRTHLAAQLHQQLHHLRVVAPDLTHKQDLALRFSARINDANVGSLHEAIG